MTRTAAAAADSGLQYLPLDRLFSSEDVALIDGGR